MRFAARLIVPRLAFAAVTLLIVSAVVFWAVELLPGDAATRILGQQATEESTAVLRDQLNLDAPVGSRYASWLGGFVTGDWGASLVSQIPSSVASAGGRQQRPVSDLVVPRLGNTLVLAAAALLLYVPISIALGLITAIYRETRLGRLITALVVGATAVPEFVVAIVLLLVFAVMLPWFPPLSIVDQAASIGEYISMLALPAITLTIAMTGYAVRMMQTSVQEVLDSDYVRLATLKGLSRRRVVLRHVLPNALGPALRVTVINVAWLIGGVVLVEVIFNFPGLGRQLIDSIRLLDTPVIEAIAMIMALVYVLANLGADLMGAVFNPKLRVE